MEKAWGINLRLFRLKNKKTIKNIFDNNIQNCFELINKFEEIKRFETFQLEWTINPENANIKQVKFESSNPEVATVDDKGFITAVANGTVTVTIISQSVSRCTDSFTFEVYSPDHFDIAYETVSYVAIDETVKLLAQYIKRDGTVEGVVW